MPAETYAPISPGSREGEGPPFWREARHLPPGRGRANRKPCACWQPVGPEPIELVVGFDALRAVTARPRADAKASAHGAIRRVLAGPAEPTDE